MKQESRDLSRGRFKSDSWPVPAFGFCAYDRVKLGWVEPMLVESTRYDLELKPAEANLQCIKIPTSSPAEYFLVEYRKKPTCGFGSLRDDCVPDNQVNSFQTTIAVLEKERQFDDRLMLDGALW